MIAHWDIIQGSREWHEIRYGKVGGTLCKSLLVKGDTLLKNVGSCYLEPFDIDSIKDDYVNDDMLRGSELEPLARRETSLYAGIELLPCGWLQSTKIPIIGISPDGITKDLKIAMESKCPAKEKHTITLYNNQIPDDNIDQCIHNFTVNPYLEKLLFVSYRPESRYPLFVKELTPDSIVDLGTKAKPNYKKVSEWVVIHEQAAIELQENIRIKNAQLDKI